jgi:hypothetical protein
MKDQKEKVKEPFSPEATPNPPQIIDPSRGAEQGETEQPLKTQPKNQQSEQKPDQQSKAQPKKKLPGESETEIDDETTI